MGQMEDKLLRLEYRFPLGEIAIDRLRDRRRELCGHSIQVEITGSLSEDLARIMKRELLKQTIKKLQEELALLS